MSGLTSEGKERIEAVAREHLARGWHTGAQVAVYRQGRTLSPAALAVIGQVKALLGTGALAD